TYTLTLNSYGGPAASVMLSDTLPPGFQFVSASDGGSVNGAVVGWSGVAVTADALKTVSLTIRVASGLSAGTHTFNPTAFLTYAGSSVYTDMTSDPAVTVVNVLPPPPIIYTGPVRVFPNPFDHAKALRG